MACARRHCICDRWCGRYQDHRSEYGRDRASPVAWTRFSRPASSSPPARASWSRATRSGRAIPRSRPRSRTSFAGVSALDVVQNVRSPLDPANSGQIAESGHAALVEFDIRGDKDEASDKVAPVLDRVDEAQRAHPELFVGEFGDASAVYETDGSSRTTWQGGPLLAPDHADHPRRCLRSARGGRHPAAAGTDRRHRDVRADRAGESGTADGE